jgi:cyclic pyranopterin phosphate synthase
VKLYDFDGVDARLELVPLAARRTLDRAGLRLSLDGWRSLSLDARRVITEAGSGPIVNLTPAMQAVQKAHPPPERIDPIDDPRADHVPAHVNEAFGEGRTLPVAVWSTLSPLDRYALAKVAASGKAARIDAAYHELIGHSAVSTHLAPQGGVRMVDVAQKDATLRRAVATSRISMNRDALSRLVRSEAPKGDVLSTARLAGIMAAKRTAELVPLCHDIALTYVGVGLEIEEANQTVSITATVEAFDRTGVEMEALVAASVAALTIYDMLKAFDRSMVIGPTQLAYKSGGKSGEFQQ